MAVGWVGKGRVGRGFSSKIARNGQQTRNNTFLPSIREEEYGSEATPTDDSGQHGVPVIALKQRQDDITDPIPHYIEDVQGILPARAGAHPVHPARKNPVRRTKTTCKCVDGILVGSKRNNVKTRLGNGFNS